MSDELGEVESINWGQLVVGGRKYGDVGFDVLHAELLDVRIEEKFGIVETLDVGQHGLVDTGIEFA